MKRRAPRRLTLRRETLRRLASGDLAKAAGGFIARCTYERSGCVGVPQPSQTCMPEDGNNEDTCWCL